MIRRALASAAAGFGVALALATPAWAHGGEAPDASNYRTTVTGMDGDLPDVSVRVVEGGARLELVNHGDRAVEVLGYAGEPYLVVGPDGVYENTNSPATYLNETLQGGDVAPGADPTAPPSWRRVGDKPRVRWHDHRTHWMNTDLPPRVAADPGRAQRIRDWVVPLRTGVTIVGVHGTLDWVPPPVAGLWWALAMLGAAAVGSLGLVSVRHRMTGGIGTGLAVLAVAAGLVAIGYAAARELDAGPAGVGDFLVGLAAGQLWPVLAGLGGIAAGAYALTRRAPHDLVPDRSHQPAADRSHQLAADRSHQPAADRSHQPAADRSHQLAADRSHQPTADRSHQPAADHSHPRAADRSHQPAATAQGSSRDFGLALAGACLALFAGIANGAVLGRGVAPVPFPPVLARIAVVMMIAVGAGLTVAGSLRLRATRT